MNCSAEHCILTSIRQPSSFASAQMMIGTSCNELW